MVFQTLVHVLLHTGRTHQIRAHFAEAGHPLAGDRNYGGRSRWAVGSSLVHVYSLLEAFSHPSPAGHTDALDGAPPEDMTF
jgi:23S rRNA pseudouridine1911/1915/1917 synthase